MADATIQLDTRQFRRAIQVYAETTRKTGAQIVNQRAYNVAGRAMDMMKPEPGGEQAQRAKIRAYMNTRRGEDRYVISKTGKRTKKKVKRMHQLVVANLIVQARRAKKGLTGLYGQAMISAEGQFVQAAQVGVGFLKSPFVAIVRGLTEYQPPGKRMPIKTRWGKISVWPGSKGYGTVNPALPGTSPQVKFELRWRVKGAPTKVQRLTLPVLQRAFDAEAAGMRQHVIDKLQEAADKINARK